MSFDCNYRRKKKDIKNIRTKRELKMKQELKANSHDEVRENFSQESRERYVFDRAG